MQNSKVQSPSPKLILSPPLNDPTAIHFGAGSIGLGFIGSLLAKAGYRVIFADVNPKVINHLKHDMTYTIRYLEPHRSRPFHVNNISGVLSNVEEGFIELAKNIGGREVKLITTSTGFYALEHIAPIIARGIITRMQEGGGTLNIIACENGKGASDFLKASIYKNLDESTRGWCDCHIGFANCSVDRIVPQPVQEQENLLNVGVDKFFEWIVDLNALKSVSHIGGEPTLNPPVPGMMITKDLAAFQARKLYIFNLGHATTAYLGTVFECKTISEAINDHKRIFPVVEGAMKESGGALLKEYPNVFAGDGMENYINKTITRFKNVDISDNVTRVGRQPLRKLGREERLLGPFLLAMKHGLQRNYLAVAVAAALMYRNDEDEQAVELKKIEEEEGVGGAVEKLLGLNQGSDDFNRVMDAYFGLEKGKHLDLKERN